MTNVGYPTILAMWVIRSPLVDTFAASERPIQELSANTIMP